MKQSEVRKIDDEWRALLQEPYCKNFHARRFQTIPFPSKGQVSSCIICNLLKHKRK